MDEPGVFQETYSGSGFYLVKDVLILDIVQFHQKPSQSCRTIDLVGYRRPVHVGGTHVPFTHVIRDVYEVERGIQIILPSAFLVYEQGEHLVQVEEVWLYLGN